MASRSGLRAEIEEVDEKQKWLFLSQTSFFIL